MPLPLTFDALDARVESYIALTAEERARPLERWSFAIGLFAAGAGSLLAALVGGQLGVWIIRAALVIEVVGLLGGIALQIGRNRVAFRYAHKAFAKELDHDYTEFLRLLADLCLYPAAELERMQRYVARRRDSMGYRLSLMTGGIERLGVLPVVVALYIQFKDWKFGDWQALGDVNMVGGLLLWALLLIYLAGWYLIRLRVRLDLYEFLLDEARRFEPSEGRTGVRELVQ